MGTKGWAKVMKFTMMNLLKSKNFRISTIVILVAVNLMVFAGNALPNVLGGDDDKSQGGIAEEFTGDTTSQTNPLTIDKVYLADSTDLGTDFSALTINYPGLEIEAIDSSAGLAQEIKTSDFAVVLVEVYEENGGYNILLSRPENTELIIEGDCSVLLNAFSSILTARKYEVAGVSADNMALATAPVITNSVIAGEKIKGVVEEIVSQILPMASSLMLFMMIFIYGQLVAQSVAIEKTSRVMELLLTSIKPLAVIIGKVLGTGIIALGQFLTMIVSGFITFSLTSNFGGKPSALSQMNVDSVIAGFGAGAVILIIMTFILGFAFYATFCGLIGASVSRMEDLAQAMQPVSLIAVVGFYLAYFEKMMGGNKTLSMLATYLPISSPFILPSKILSGEMNLAEGIVSLLVLAGFVFLLGLLVAKVYETIILHSGNRIKLSEMFKIAQKK